MSDRPDYEKCFGCGTLTRPGEIHDCDSYEIMDLLEAMYAGPEQTA